MTTTEQTEMRPARERHVARSARILSTGLSATAILGITAAFGAAERAEPMTQTAAPVAPLASPTGTQGPLVPLGSSAPGLAPAPTTTLASADTVVGADTMPITAPTTVQPIATIAPATPVVELTLPPPPSNGSSGGSR